MAVPIQVRLADPDSETYLLTVRKESVPEGSTLIGANNQALVPDSDTGDYILTPEDVKVFQYVAPQHYSDVSESDKWCCFPVFCAMQET
jgi:hypothetical protein